MEVTFAKEYSAILKDLLHYLGLIIMFEENLNTKSQTLNTKSQKSTKGQKKKEVYPRITLITRRGR